MWLSGADWAIYGTHFDQNKWKSSKCLKLLLTAQCRFSLIQMHITQFHSLQGQGSDKKQSVQQYRRQPCRTPQPTLDRENSRNLNRSSLKAKEQININQRMGARREKKSHSKQKQIHFSEVWYAIFNQSICEAEGSRSNKILSCSSNMVVSQLRSRTHEHSTEKVGGVQHCVRNPPEKKGHLFRNLKVV